VDTDAEQWRTLIHPWEAQPPAQTQGPVGCLECRMTGYLGRIGIYEIMLLSSSIQGLVNGTAEPARIREQAYKDGMRPLRISGALKVAAGVTTAEEVLKVAPPQ
jgi:general secretion pathway protein E